MRITTLLLFLLALVTTNIALGDSGFLISQWCGPLTFTKKTIAEDAHDGFNVIMLQAGRNANAKKKALKLCWENGVKGMIVDRRLHAALTTNGDFKGLLDAVIKDYSRFPGLWGYLVADEPNASKFKRLAAINRYLLEKDPRHIPFININPNWASPAELGSRNYEGHVDKYLRVVRPKLLSFDNYPLLATNERPRYYENFEVIRRESIKYHTPFCYILLSVPHAYYRNPSEADMRWEVNSALAYGAKGILYFTYTTPRSTGAERSYHYHDAIIDAHGRRSEKYKEVKRINAEVKELAPLLTRLKSMGVYNTPPLPEGTVALPKDNWVKEIQGGGFLVGEFKSDNGGHYLMFVNRSPRQSAYARIIFSRKVKLFEVSRKSGRERVIQLGDSGPTSVWAVHFGPGQGRLVHIQVQ